MTAENHGFSQFRRRAAAMLLDGLLFIFLSAILRGLVLISLGRDLTAAQNLMQSWPGAQALIAPVLIALCWILFQGTPGKLLLGLQLIDARSGRAPSVRQVLLRLLGYGLSALPLGLGFLWMAWDKQGQAWHDKLAGTAVVFDHDAYKSLRQLQAELR